MNCTTPDEKNSSVCVVIGLNALDEYVSPYFQLRVDWAIHKFDLYMIALFDILLS